MHLKLLLNLGLLSIVLTGTLIIRARRFASWKASISSIIAEMEKLKSKLDKWSEPAKVCCSNPTVLYEDTAIL